MSKLLLDCADTGEEVRIGKPITSSKVANAVAIKTSSFLLLIGKLD
jgi:hypothetical protein